MTLAELIASTPLGRRKVAEHRVWGLGLSRTGTSSLHEALRILGYQTVHYPQTLRRARRFEAACDSPVPLHYEFLDRTYPGSKFILTLRDVESWQASMEYLHSRNRLDRNRWLKAREVLDCHETLYGTLTFDREKMIRGYERHVAAVRRYFDGDDERLLEMNISAGDGWEKLCPFLGKPIPEVDFPHSNRRRE